MQGHLRPGHPAFATRPPRSRPSRAVRRGMRILVVDHDDDRRDLICVAVSVLGHRAEEAWNTRHALLPRPLRLDTDDSAAGGGFHLTAILPIHRISSESLVIRQETGKVSTSEIIYRC